MTRIPDKGQVRERLSTQLRPVRRALVVTSVYAVAALIWIAFSDLIVGALVTDPETLSRVQTWKGFFFVSVTALVLFLALLRLLTRDRTLLRLQHDQSLALRKRERQLTVLMDSLPGMAYRCRYDDHGTMLFVSEGCVELTGYEPDELMDSRAISYGDMLDRESYQHLLCEIRSAMASEEPYSVEYALTRKDGQQVWVWERGRAIHEGEDGTMLEGIVLDISDRKRLRDELEELATRDPLTGLLNRREMSRVLEEELERARRYQRPMAMLWIDFDRFKAINDTYGHAAGDSVLQSATGLLAESVRSVDSIGRFGGEEFVIVLPEMGVAEAQETAERLRRHVSATPQPLGDGRVVSLTISVGVAVYPRHGVTGPALCAAADKAMYQAKTAGRNCVALAHVQERVHNEQ
eukprot:TRINITY_DN7851_c0_g1_i1.p1 TRINITY_DN7851_c0_g1~~TRINITY_DN7851_c0_g1_i1.p1  ORF type:complete len:407 (-),score=38.43 TRINITY_DN7851_c0_g1_i1:897-2117(-)